MISAEEICEIGRILKTHGINGELNATIESDIELQNLSCIILDIDGIYVPFFLNNIRPRGAESVLITIDGINDEKDAADLCGLTVYGLKSESNAEGNDENGFYVNDLIGFTLFDENNKKIGVVEDFDDSTANLLLSVRNDSDTTLYVPLADELVVDFDFDNKTLTLNLPEGLLQI